ncbi:MAG: copper chaperone PCu(A)C [Acetobacteraceae bacterium]|nr:copper chaperone PCu(A)C [Acetobacteraceae bacterium]
MRRHLFGLAALAALALTHPAAAHDYRAGDIAIGHPWTRAVAAGAPTAAGYMTLRNDGSVPDRLLSASTPMARTVELHETALADGIMRMRPLTSGLVIPAGETVRLEPGGIHAMLMGPSVPFARGARVPLTLRFERAGEVTVELAVEAPGARGGDHQGH